MLLSARIHFIAMDTYTKTTIRRGWLGPNPDETAHLFEDWEDPARTGKNTVEGLFKKKKKPVADTTTKQ